MLISSFRRSMKWHGIFPLSPRWGTTVPLRIFSHHLPHRYLLRHIFCPNIFGLVKDDKSEKGTRSSPAPLPPQLARLSVCSCCIPVLSVVVVRNFFLLNYNEKLDKVRNVLSCWKYRRRTLIGKVTVLKSLVASQLVYVLSPLHTNENIIKEVNKLFNSFLWNGKGDKISEI